MLSCLTGRPMCRLLREYFGLEFCGLALPWSGKVDVERIIDDFVLLCMFTGNDFLPGEPWPPWRAGAA